MIYIFRSMPDVALSSFIRSLPKAELHVHLCGTIEPEMMFRLAARNGVALPYASVEALRAAYRFENLNGFLELYTQGTLTVRTEADFYDVTLAYLEKAHQQGVVHAEPSIDPQTFLRRGIPLEVLLNGIHSAMSEAQTQWGITSLLTMDFIREFGAASAMELIQRAQPYAKLVSAVGLGSRELGYPPSDFTAVFDAARKNGWKTVAHAGEEGPPDYVRQAVDLLKVDRIDHGIRGMEDEALMETLARRRIPLTLCPLSNVALNVTPDLARYPLKEMLNAGIVATINSDDPPYFGGYVLENYLAVAEALQLDKSQLTTLARNSIEASFLGNEEKSGLYELLENVKR